MASHVESDFYSNRDTLWPTVQPNRSKTFFCIHGTKNYKEPSDFVHTLIWWVIWPLSIYVMVGQFFALWWTETLGVVLSRGPRLRKLCGHFCLCFEIVGHYKELSTQRPGSPKNTTQQHDVSVQSTLDRRPMYYSQKMDPSSPNANAIMWTHTSLEINVKFKIK